MRTLTVSDPAFLGAKSLTPPSVASTVACWWATDLVASTADGNPVGSWVDRVNGVTVSSSSTARPTMRWSSIGSQPAVDFDGSDDYLELGSSLASSDTQGAVIAVCQYDVTTNKCLWSQSTASTAANYLYLSPRTTGNYPLLDLYNSPTVSMLRGSTAIGTGARVLEVSSNASTISMRVNNTAETVSVDSGSNAGRWFSQVTANRWCIGALTYNNSRIAFFDGKLAFLLRTSAPLSAGDRTALYGWITAYYGI